MILAPAVAIAGTLKCVVGWLCFLSVSFNDHGTSCCYTLVGISRLPGSSFLVIIFVCNEIYIDKIWYMFIIFNALICVKV